MRKSVLALVILPLAAPAAFADGFCPKGDSFSKGCSRATAHRSKGPRAFYPPTYLVDGRAYYYYPGENGRPDEPVQPFIPEYVYERHFFWE